MLPHIHLIAGIIGSGVLYYFNFLDSYAQALIFIIASVLIDIDHIFSYLLRLDLDSVKKVFVMGLGKKRELPKKIDFFHTPEINLIILIASFYNKIFLIIFLSNLLHIILDTYASYRRYGNFRLLKYRCLIYRLLN